jgi:hypothetical protein
MYIFTVEEVIVMWTLGITICHLYGQGWSGQFSLVDASKQLTFASESQRNQHTGNFYSVDKIGMISTFVTQLQTIWWRECPVNSQTTKCDHLSPNRDGSYPQFIPCLSHGKRLLYCIQDSRFGRKKCFYQTSISFTKATSYKEFLALHCRCI